jgi:hypothetical protein
VNYLVRFANWPELSKLNLANWLALASGVIALLSFWNALAARRIAKASHRLSLESRDRSRPAMEFQIERGYIKSDRVRATKVFVFGIVVSNRSDLPNAIKRFSLQLILERGQPPPSKLIIHHDSTWVSHSGQGGGETFQLPAPIPPRGAAAGLLIFPIPTELLAGSYTETVRVSMTDTFDNVISREVLLLCEQED